MVIKMRSKKIQIIKINTVIISLLLAVLIITGCQPQVSKTETTTSDSPDMQPQAWIDAPLNESHIPLVPYEIVFHVSAQSNVSLGELSINEQVAALLVVDDSSKNLATLKYLWEPEQPGKYILHARPQTSDGDWGPASSAVVYIDAEETPTLTATPETEGEAGITNIQADPKQVNFGSCQPNQLTISAHAETPAGIKSFSVFYRFSDTSGNLTGWQNEAMSPIGGGDYEKVINITTAAETLGFNSQKGTFIYQLIIQDQNGDMVRGDVLRDVSVVRCEGYRLPLLKTVMPKFPIHLITPTVPYIK